MSARRHAGTWTRLASLLTAMGLIAALGATAQAATTTKPYTATWLSGGVPVANPPNTLSLPSGLTTAVLRITNNANPQSLGSANITLPAGYTLIGGALSPAIGTATPSGNTLQLRDLSLLPSSYVDVTIDLRTPCMSSGPDIWTLVVKQANNFSGSPGNDFVRATGTVAPSTSVSGSTCLLRFANQPGTTQTGALITDAYRSSGNPIRVEIYDPGTGLTVSSTATVTLVPDHNPAGGTLSGGSVNAVAGTATFSDLSLDTPGPYTLRASSPVATNTPVSDQFMVADTLDQCQSLTCSFTQQLDLNTYTTTPKKGTTGATYVTSLNLPGLRISCDFAPFNYPDSRQPNAVWYTYDDGGASLKTNVIVIDKSIVQVTPNNGASFYRVCYSSPVPFVSRLVTGWDLINGVVQQTSDGSGSYAPPDPWSDGPSAYFGQTWYTGLLPDCGNKKNPPAPCVISWTGDNAGNRVGTFVTPPGDPSYR